MDGTLDKMFLVVLLSFVAGLHSLKISEIAVPPALPDGESAELQCRYKLDTGEKGAGLVVKWWFTPLGEPGSKAQLYQRLDKHPAQSLKDKVSVKENDSIELQSLRPADSGTYECEIYTNDQEVRERHTMIVYSEGTGPQLNITYLPDEDDDDTTENQVHIQCSAEGVAPEPEISVSINDVVLNLNNSQEVTGPSDGRYNVSAAATVTADSVVGKTVKCELFFTDETVSHPAYLVAEDFEVSGDTTTWTPDGENLESTTAVPEDVEPNAGTILHSSATILFSVLNLMRLL